MRGGGDVKLLVRQRRHDGRKRKLKPMARMVHTDMLTFIQFIEEIAQKDLTILPADVNRMRERFGDKVLKMGHLQEDGSMLVPVDCVLEAAQSLGAQTLTEAAGILKNDEMVNMFQSAETLVERVGEARERNLRELVRKFQSESQEADAHRQWKQIENMVFGVDYPD
jgi:predicted CoA-binding protein